MASGIFWGEKAVLDCIARTGHGRGFTLTLMEQLGIEQVKPRERRWIETPRNFLYFCSLLLLLHSASMLYRYGELPSAPVIGDEITINDPAIALSRGQGF